MAADSATAIAWRQRGLLRPYGHWTAMTIAYFPRWRVATNNKPRRSGACVMVRNQLLLATRETESGETNAE